MKIIVDYDRCQGHWVCVSEAPEVFEADERTGQVILREASPDEALRTKVMLAVKYCPTRALKLDQNQETK